MEITLNEQRVLDRIYLLFEEGEEFTSREAIEKMNFHVGQEIEGFRFTLNGIPKSPYKMTAILKKDKNICREYSKTKKLTTWWI